MPKGDQRWMHVWGAGTFILTLIGTWILVRHEEEHRAGTMAIILAVLSGVALLALNAYSIYRNLRDASRAKAKDAEIVALRSEHKSLLEGRNLN
jgi:ABC-type nickel/cobalt efflux system permease component RcnA